jgi:hypothetical protein
MSDHQALIEELERLSSLLTYTPTVETLNLASDAMLTAAAALAESQQVLRDERKWRRDEVRRQVVLREAAEARVVGLTEALASVDEPYPIDIFPDLQERDEVYAAMRSVNEYATEQFYAEVARDRGRVARAVLAHLERLTKSA